MKLSMKSTCLFLPIMISIQSCFFCFGDQYHRFSDEESDMFLDHTTVPNQVMVTNTNDTLHISQITSEHGEDMKLCEICVCDVYNEEYQSIYDIRDSRENGETVNLAAHMMSQSDHNDNRLFINYTYLANDSIMDMYLYHHWGESLVFNDTLSMTTVFDRDHAEIKVYTLFEYDSDHPTRSISWSKEKGWMRFEDFRRGIIHQNP